MIGATFLILTIISVSFSFSFRSGGNHFRAWKQNGTLADSGAWFLALVWLSSYPLFFLLTSYFFLSLHSASKEENSGKNHMIVVDGYNIGRDWIVDRAIRGTHYRNMWWRAELEWNENDLLLPGNEGE